LKGINLGEKNGNWKGPNVSKAAGRARARRKFPLTPCSVCGNPKSERHHLDDNPLNNDPTNVISLCRKDHMEADLRIKGLVHSVRNSGKFKIEDAKVREIEKSLIAGVSETKLAGIYGVTPTQIYYIKTGKSPQSKINLPAKSKYKLTDQQIMEIRISSEKNIVLSKKYGICPQHVSNIRLNKSRI
jgi:hypothetical protein